MKNLLKLLDLSTEDIIGILHLADELKYERKHNIPHELLKGQTLGMIFQKSSTRTRVSFETGMYQLGGHALFLSSRDLQIGRGEPVQDTARVLSRYLDGIMIRTFEQKEVEDLAKFGSIPVINGLTDFCHPCQVLADLMTIREKFGSFSGLKMCFIGDGNNMANSLIVGGLKVGMNVAVATPDGYKPDGAVLEFTKGYGDKFALETDPFMAASGADILITDIKMPYMDGLELARALNEDYQNIHIIIFTGFDEFEYAKEAVHLEIEEYMLKPINSQELSECLKRLKKTLDNEREEKLNVKKLEHYFNASLPMFQTNLFISLIEGRITEADCEKFLAAYQIHMTGPLFGCAVFHTSEHHVPEGMNALLLSMSVEQEIRERIAEKWKSQMFTYLGNTVLVMELNSEEEAVAFADDCDRFCRWAYRVMGAVVTAGIGRACDSLFTINQSYAGAREAVSYRVLYGTQRAINIGEIAPTEQEISVQSEDTKMHALFKTINLGSREEIEKAAQSEIEKLHRNAKTVSQYKLATMEMVGAFYRFCANNFIDFKDYCAEVENPYEKVPEMDESTLKGWLVNSAVAISEELKNARNTTSRRIVEEAKGIVRDRYMQPDLSLDTVCSELGVSNSYFSSLFKKETGKTFISWLTDYRMDHAADLMLETNEKSYKIAERVGYQDANYFSYVFKKRFGMSPSKYRTSHKK